MPVPLPTPDTVNLRPPDRAEAALVHRGIRSAIAMKGVPTHLQQLVVSAVTRSMTGFDVSDAIEPLGAAELAAVLERRDSAFRTRVVQIMILGGLILAPVPAEIARQLRDYAAELGVDDEMIAVAEAYARGALDLAAIDFSRNGYLSRVDPDRINALHASALNTAWETVEHDAQLTARWQELEGLPLGTIGRDVTDFYRDRGFVYPGLPGSAPPLLAQHDWLHVLAGYGTTLENEVEVFAFMARANDDPHAFSLLAMIVSLFETGLLASGAGLFQANAGHLSTAGMADRLADALRRGALLQGSFDFLDYDWFAVADRPVRVLRAELGVVDKSPAALVNGSVGPWHSGGITEYQLGAARRAAEVQDRTYVPWRPDPERD